MPEARTLTAALHQEEEWYVAQCLEVDVASQGRTIDEALANLAEAVQLYLEEVDDPAGHLTATPLVTELEPRPPDRLIMPPDWPRVGGRSGSARTPRG